jgi:hypothetical protein
MDTVLGYNDYVATELTPLGKIVKWVVAPVIVALVCYAFVGPHIGGEVVQKVRQIPIFGDDSADGEKKLDDPSQSRAKNFRDIRRSTTN